MLFDDKDPRHVAALMDAILSDTALQDAIVEGQTPPSGGFRPRISPAPFSASSIGFSASPRAAGPKVAFDFWHQFDAAQALEELRQVRPALYKALP